MPSGDRLSITARRHLGRRQRLATIYIVKRNLGDER